MEKISNNSVCLLDLIFIIRMVEVMIETPGGI